MRLGATGRFPDGKIFSDDEGELNLGITRARDGTIIMHFGKAVSWMAMSSENAIRLAMVIIHHARGD